MHLQTADPGRIDSASINTVSVSNMQSTRVKCDNCGIELLKSSLPSHEKGCRKEKELFCPVCKRSYFNPKSLGSHIRRKHKKK